VLDVLPSINATLNGLATILLALGYKAIRRKDVELHKRCMISAVAVSVLFLACYLTYHFLKHQATGQGHTPFGGTGIIRPIYFALLISHVILAAVNLPMILITLYRAYKGQFEKHRRIARWAWPIWMYVSVTGVIVYFMLYHLFSPGPSP
jgi:uncharacterized membrane protein YozB (DUF420 family)